MTTYTVQFYNPESDSVESEKIEADSFKSSSHSPSVTFYRNSSTVRDQWNRTVPGAEKVAFYGRVVSVKHSVLDVDAPLGMDKPTAYSGDEEGEDDGA